MTKLCEFIFGFPQLFSTRGNRVLTRVLWPSSYGLY